MVSAHVSAESEILQGLSVKHGTSKSFGNAEDDNYDLLVKGDSDVYGSLTVHGKYTVAKAGVLDFGAAASGQGKNHSQITAREIVLEGDLSKPYRGPGAQLWMYNESASWRTGTLSAERMDFSRSFEVRSDRNTLLEMKGRQDGAKTEVSLGIMKVKGKMLLDGHGLVTAGNGIIFRSKTEDQGFFTAGSMTWEKGSEIWVDGNDGSAYGTVVITDVNQMALGDITVDGYDAKAGTSAT